MAVILSGKPPSSSGRRSGWRRRLRADSLLAGTCPTDSRWTRSQEGAQVPVLPLLQALEHPRLRSGLRAGRLPRDRDYPGHKVNVSRRAVHCPGLGRGEQELEAGKRALDAGGSGLNSPPSTGRCPQGCWPTLRKRWRKGPTKRRSTFSANW